MKCMELELKVWAYISEQDFEGIEEEITSCLQQDGSLLENCAVETQVSRSKDKHASLFRVAILFSDKKYDEIYDSILEESHSRLKDFFQTYDLNAIIRVDIISEGGLLGI